MNYKHQIFLAALFLLVVIASPFVALFIGVCVFFSSLYNLIVGSYYDIYKSKIKTEQEEPTNIWDRHIANMKVKNNLR